MTVGSERGQKENSDYFEDEQFGLGGGMMDKYRVREEEKVW